jgi:lysozyme
MTDTAVAVATQMIAKEEGYREYAYQDIVGVWTIGIGFTILEDGKPVTAGTPPMPKPRALAYLATFVERLVAAIRAMTPDRPLTTNQCAALADFSFEEGISALRDSTLMREWNAGNVEAAEAQFLVWDVAGGRHVPAIEARRKAELALFKTPNSAVPPVSPVPAPAPPQDEANRLMDRYD